MHIIFFRLPHAHFLVILKDRFKIRTADDIDQIICAEVPDPQANPRLYKLVSERMVHGPCGTRNLNCPCMEVDENGVKACSKGFPKPYTPTTVFQDDGYPIYRRRNRHHIIKV